MATDPKAVRQYQENQILTAPREELLLLLFDGAIRFGEQARQRFSDQQIEEGTQLVIRAQRVVLELMGALDRKVGEELYRNLTGLYAFVARRLVAAGTQRDGAALDEAMVVLRRLRETWGDAVAQVRRDRHPEIGLLERAKQQRPEAPLTGASQ